MKRICLRMIPFCLTLALFAGCSKSATDADAAASPPQQTAASNAQFGVTAKPAAVPIMVPAGTVLQVRMRSTLSSATASSGQNFEATLEEPLVIDGQTIAPRGADVTGTVVDAKSSGRLHKPGYLRITLSSIDVKGKPAEIETSSVLVQGGSHKKRNWAIIGGSTAGGALIGGLAGGGKGALIGSAIGAGGSTGVAYGTGKKDVSISAERALSFRLTQPLTIS